MNLNDHDLYLEWFDQHFYSSNQKIALCHKIVMQPPSAGHPDTFYVGNTLCHATYPVWNVIPKYRAKGSYCLNAETKEYNDTIKGPILCVLMDNDTTRDNDYRIVPRYIMLYHSRYFTPGESRNEQGFYFARIPVLVSKGKKPIVIRPGYAQYKMVEGSHVMGEWKC